MCTDSVSTKDCEILGIYPPYRADPASPAKVPCRGNPVVTDYFKIPAIFLLIPSEQSRLFATQRANEFVIAASVPSSLWIPSSMRWCKFPKERSTRSCVLRLTDIRILWHLQHFLLLLPIYPNLYYCTHTWWQKFDFVTMASGSLNFPMPAPGHRSIFKRFLIAFIQLVQGTIPPP